MTDAQLYKKFQKSPIFFVEKMWGITVERDNSKFVKGKHLSWQQHDILLAVEKAIQGKDKKRITVASGHGIGKTAVLSWLLLWYLFCYKDSQIPCTAPTSEQMFDVLWKEVNKWLMLMPGPIKDLYEWQSTHVRVKEHPETWFARAKTARKEAPEALAGIHGDFVLYLVDEASGVAQEIFNTAEGALTDKNVLVILISNYTRLVGYFHHTHTSDRENWQTMNFSSIESPLVENDYVERIKAKHGEDSDEYRIRVLGLPPKEDAIDQRGYVPLLLESDLKFVTDEGRLRHPRLGVDPAGEGRDETAWVGRDQFRAKIQASEKISTPKTIAEKTVTLMDHLETDQVTIDDFGVGAKTVQELGLAHIRALGVNVNEQADDSERFVNRRAEAFFRLREWLRSGGELVRDERWMELLNIRYKRNLKGKLQIMSKDEMRREGIPSPNYADALMLTFVRKENFSTETLSQEQVHEVIGVY